MGAREPDADSLAAGFAQRTAVAVAYCKRGKGSIKLNGCPIELIEPEVLRHKVRRRPNPPFLASRRRTEPRAAESAREAGPGWPGIAARRPAAGQRGRLDCTDTAGASRCRCTSRS